MAIFMQKINKYKYGIRESFFKSILLFAFEISLRNWKIKLKQKLAIPASEDNVIKMDYITVVYTYLSYIEYVYTLYLS